MANEKLCGVTVAVITLLWISCVSSQSCGIGCIDPNQCQPYHDCRGCKDGFYMDYNSENIWRCFQCPQVCRTCSHTDKSCYDCKDGYFMNNNKCAKCFEECSKCVNQLYNCSHQCKPGRWGASCQYSCTPCSECVDKRCTDHCNKYEGPSICGIGKCPDQRCSFGFIGSRRSDIGTQQPPTTRRTLPPITTRRTLPPITTRRTLPPITTRRTLPPITTRRTLPPITTRRTLLPITTKRTPTPTTTRRTLRPITTKIPLPLTTTMRTLSPTSTRKINASSRSTMRTATQDLQTKDTTQDITVKTESQTDGLDPVYTVLAVVGVLVLAVAVVIVVVIWRKRRKRHQDQESTPQETNNEDIIYAKPNKVRKPDSQTGQSTELDLQRQNKDPPSISAPEQSNRASNNVPSLVTDTTLDIEIIMETCLDESETVVTEASTKDDDTYYNVLSFKRNKIKVDKFEEYVKSKKTFDFYTEFQKFPKGLSRPHTHANKPENKVKCRYNGVYPYDTNRVKLVGEGNDFINASYIDGYTRQKEYIACLGPTKVTMADFVDFWAMVWQEKVEKIVMLTRLVEETKMKCEQYWPDFGDTNRYGDVTVTCESEDVYPDYRFRKLSVKQGETTRFVYQTHFLSWPDKRVPETTDVLLTLRNQVRALKSEMDGPIVVHCSAGVGRTGTYIALDILLQQLTEEGAVDVFGCVIGIRGQRVAMVQTLEQYEYIHNVLLEKILEIRKS